MGRGSARSAGNKANTSMAQRRNDRKQEGSSDMPRQMPSEIDRQMKEAAAGIGAPYEDGNRLLDYPNFEAAFNDLSGNAG